MGGPRKLKKQYITPGHPWQKDRLNDELRLMGQYGLRSKRELWRIRTLLGKYRAQARNFLALPEEEMKQRLERLITRLATLGIVRTDRRVHPKHPDPERGAALTRGRTAPRAPARAELGGERAVERQPEPQ